MSWGFVSIDEYFKTLMFVTSVFSSWTMLKQNKKRYRGRWMEGPIELEGKEIEGTSIPRRNSKTIRKLFFPFFSRTHPKLLKLIPTQVNSRWIWIDLRCLQLTAFKYRWKKWKKKKKKNSTGLKSHRLKRMIHFLSLLKLFVLAGWCRLESANKKWEIYRHEELSQQDSTVLI